MYDNFVMINSILVDDFRIILHASSSQCMDSGCISMYSIAIDVSLLDYAYVQVSASAQLCYYSTSLMDYLCSRSGSYRAVLYTHCCVQAITDSAFSYGTKDKDWVYRYFTDIILVHCNVWFYISAVRY